MFSEQDILMLSGIQHFVFCKRQWGLIHIENQWSDNLRTVEGNIMHARAHDKKQTEVRGDVIIARGMAIFSSVLGVSGVCDVVEFHRGSKGVTLFGREGTFKPIPVEYKKGIPKGNDADILQLVAQAMCLEEMLVCDIEEGYLYYGETKRRTKVNIDAVLREKVKICCKEMHQLYRRGHTPKVKPTKACNACSLKNLCLPKLCKKRFAHDYIQKNVIEGDEI